MDAHPSAVFLSFYGPVCLQAITCSLWAQACSIFREACCITQGKKIPQYFLSSFTATQTNGPVRPKAPCAELPCSQTTDGFVCSAIIKEFVNFTVKQKNRFHLCRRYLKSLSGTLQYFAKRRYDLFPNRHPCSAVP